MLGTSLSGELKLSDWCPLLAITELPRLPALSICENGTTDRIHALGYDVLTKLVWTGNPGSPKPATRLGLVWAINCYPVVLPPGTALFVDICE